MKAFIMNGVGVLSLWGFWSYFKKDLMVCNMSPVNRLRAPTTHSNTAISAGPSQKVW